MGKISFITAPFMLLAFYVTAQNKVIKKDFNKDGLTDQVKISGDGGSTFSSTDVNYTDGKTKSKYEFSTLYSFGSFFAICNAPSVLGKSGRELLGKQLFGSIDTVEESLSWLIDACSNMKEVNGLSLVDFATNYTPKWIKGEPEIPVGYFAILSNMKYQGLLKNVEGSPDYDSKKFKSDYFWIDYNPSSHDAKTVKRGQPRDTAGFRMIQVDSITHLYITGHGVILKREAKYSWAFINDYKLLSGNEKLRWPSITDAQMLNDFILVQHIAGMINSLFIVNPQTGFVMRLSNGLMGLNSVEKITIDKGKETVELNDSEGKKYLLTLKMINDLFKR